jgi:adenylate cyclase
VIGDFQGDAVMGFWGWPLADDDRAEHAARSALILHRKLSLGARTTGQEGVTFHCGAGIASGRVIAGRLGTYDQAKISVYGPRVNLASRLESLTKLFKVNILIDDATAALLARKPELPWFRCRRVARVVPYGMTEVVEISELLPPAAPGTLSEGDRRRYETALDAFIAGQWPVANELLEPLHRDGPSEVLRKFMEEHQHEPPSGWNGAMAMRSK